MVNATTKGDAADNQESIEYSYSIVTYLDLLGFRDLVNSESDANKINEVLNKLRKNAEVPQDMAKPMSLKLWTTSLPRLSMTLS